MTALPDSGIQRGLSPASKWASMRRAPTGPFRLSYFSSSYFSPASSAFFLSSVDARNAFALTMM
jgi:hypothetical protein